MTVKKVSAMLASQLNIDEKVIKPTSKIVEDLGADSLDMIEMLMTMEEEFGVSVPDDKAETLKTVADIVNFIDENSKEEK